MNHTTDLHLLVREIETRASEGAPLRIRFEDQGGGLFVYRWHGRDEFLAVSVNGMQHIRHGFDQGGQFVETENVVWWADTESLGRAVRYVRALERGPDGGDDMAA